MILLKLVLLHDIITCVTNFSSFTCDTSVTNGTSFTCVTSVTSSILVTCIN